MLAAALLSGTATAHCGAETGGLRVERGQHDVLPVEDVNGKTVMPANDHKGLNARWVEAWNARDWTAEAACRTQDYVAHMSGVPVPLDAAGWDGFTKTFLAAFPDAQITIDGAVEEGALMASRWTMRGTHRGDFQGVPATGRPIVMAGMDFEQVVGAETGKDRVLRALGPGQDAQDRRLEIVVDTLGRHATQPLEGAPMPLQEGFQLLRGRSPGKGRATGSHPQTEQMHRDRCAGDLHLGLTPIDLPLLTEGRRQRDKNLRAASGRRRATTRRTLDSAPTKPYSATRRS